MEDKSNTKEWLEFFKTIVIKENNFSINQEDLKNNIINTIDKLINKSK